MIENQPLRPRRVNKGDDFISLFNILDVTEERFCSDSWKVGLFIQRSPVQVKDYSPEEDQRLSRPGERIARTLKYFLDQCKLDYNEK